MRALWFPSHSTSLPLPRDRFTSELNLGSIATLLVSICDVCSLNFSLEELSFEVFVDGIMVFFRCECYCNRAYLCAWLNSPG